MLIVVNSITINTGNFQKHSLQVLQSVLLKIRVLQRIHFGSETCLNRLTLQGPEKNDDRVSFLNYTLRSFQSIVFMSEAVRFPPVYYY